MGVIANVAKTEELFYLRERIEEWKRNGCRTEQADILFFRHIPELGSVQEAYAACLIAWNNYLQHMQENRIYETEMTNAIAALGNSVAEWEKKFLLTVPVKGTVAFMQPWKKKQLVEKGETMFVVIPKDTICYVGKALLPMNGIGKVQLGQRTIIRLPAFPEQEFGFIEGKVKSVSPVPNSEGYYVVEILFPNGLLTNHGKELPLIRSLEGTASIVTQEKSLLEKLLNFRL